MVQLLEVFLTDEDVRAFHGLPADPFREHLGDLTLDMHLKYHYRPQAIRALTYSANPLRGFLPQ